VNIYDLTMGEDGQVVINLLHEFEDFQSEHGLIHSGIRFRDPRFIFLVDASNFYKMNTETKDVQVI